MPSECLKCGHSQNQGCPGGTERQSDPGGVCSGCWHRGCNKWSDCEGSSGNCLYKRTSEWRHRRSSGGVRSYLAQKLGWCYSSKGAIFIRPVVLREMAESSRNLPQDKNIFSVVFFCAFSHEFSSLQPDRLQIASLSFHMQPRLAHSRCACVYLVATMCMQTVSLSSWWLTVSPHTGLTPIMAPWNCSKIWPANLC